MILHHIPTNTVAAVSEARWAFVHGNELVPDPDWIEPEPGEDGVVPDHPLIEVPRYDDPLAVLLAKRGWDALDVDVYTPEDWALTSEYAQRLAAKESKAEEQATNRSALDKVAQHRPELANDTAMAVIYSLWPALDKTQLPQALKLAVQEWATEKGYL